jgi:hypothetical protein
MKLDILTFFLILLSSCGQSQDSISSWTCESRILTFSLYKPWTKLPTLDTKEKTLTGVIDNSDGKSYIIQITDDIPQSRLSDKTYFEEVKQTMLKPNEKNKLVSEDTWMFHNMPTHRQTFLMYTDKWGLLKQINYVFRNGVEFISVQILFPVDEASYLKDSIPEALVKFDKTVKINLN